MSCDTWSKCYFQLQFIFIPGKESLSLLFNKSTHNNHSSLLMAVWQTQYISYLLGHKDCLFMTIICNFIMPLFQMRKLRLKAGLLCLVS